MLTVSDTRDEESDTSGHLLADRIARDGHSLAGRALVKDDVAAIQAQLRSWIADPEVDVIVSTGGTGLTGRDVTPEAVRPLFDKKIDGFEVVWHMISYQTVGAVDPAVARLRRHCQRHADLLPAGLERRLQGRLGQSDPLAARQPAPPLQPGGADPALHGEISMAKANSPISTARAARAWSMSAARRSPRARRWPRAACA